MGHIPTDLLSSIDRGPVTEHSVSGNCGKCSSNMGTYDMVEWLEIVWIFVVPIVAMTWLEDWVMVKHGERE